MNAYEHYVIVKTHIVKKQIMSYKQNHRHNKKSRSSKFLVILVALLLVSFSGFFAYKHFFQKKNSNTIYTPPTQEEKQSGNEIKPEVVKRQEQEDAQKKDSTNSSTPTTSTNNNAEVIITDAAQYNNVIEVRSFVANKYQDGTCKITLTKGELVVSKETKAYKDATTTICTNPLIDRSEFKQTGDWQVFVQYTAGATTGSSKPQTVKIE